VVDTGGVTKEHAPGRHGKREFLAIVDARRQIFCNMTEQFSRGYTVELEKQGNLLLALFAGAITAIIGAGLWLGVDLTVSEQAALYTALVIGLLVGFTVRVTGRGGNMLFGMIGALLTLAGCLGGAIFTTLYRASSPQRDLYAVATTTDYVQMVNYIFSHMSTMGYVVFGIALIEGYLLSIAK
jgi:hypothetical protein